MSDFQTENIGLMHYPFGMLMPGQNFGSETYRFGFQNQEKDDEIKGDGNSVNYKYRVHDPRLARFLSIDPLAPSYPWNSPYAFSENRVIDGIELEGKEYHSAGKPVGTDPETGTFHPGSDNLTPVEYPSNYTDIMHRSQQLSRIEKKLLNAGTLSQDYSNSIYKSKGHEEMTQANFRNTVEMAPGGTLLTKTIKGEEITTFDWGVEIAGIFTPLKYFKRLGKASTFGAKTSSRVFTQTAKEGDLLFYSTKIGDDVIEFGGNFSKSNGTLTIKNFDIDGALTNKLGIRGIKDVITDFGRQQGVSQVIIQGAKRTTGANPGKIPSQLTFKIE